MQTSVYGDRAEIVRGNIHWYYDSLTPRAAVFVVAVEARIAEVLEEMASQVEEYAEFHAPWEDRTGAARDGLTAEYVDLGAAKHGIVLYHTVEYGIWLGIRWNGQYAIIIPTIEHMGPVIMAELESLFSILD